MLRYASHYECYDSSNILSSWSQIAVYYSWSTIYLSDFFFPSSVCLFMPYFVLIITIIFHFGNFVPWPWGHLQFWKLSMNFGQLHGAFFFFCFFFLESPILMCINLNALVSVFQWTEWTALLELQLCLNEVIILLRLASAFSVVILNACVIYFLTSLQDIESDILDSLCSTVL